jgi:hypothetical protein
MEEMERVSHKRQWPTRAKSGTWGHWYANTMMLVGLGVVAVNLSWLPDKLDILGGSAAGGVLGAAIGGGIALAPTRSSGAGGRERRSGDSIARLTAWGTLTGYVVTAIFIAVLVVTGTPHSVVK